MRSAASTSAQRLEHRSQIAGFIIDHGYAHSLISKFVHRFDLTFPQGLKPAFILPPNGTTKVVP
jgi:hypothetical protein